MKNKKFYSIFFFKLRIPKAEPLGERRRVQNQLEAGHCIVLWLTARL